MAVVQHLFWAGNIGGAFPGSTRNITGFIDVFCPLDVESGVPACPQGTRIPPAPLSSVSGCSVKKRRCQVPFDRIHIGKAETPEQETCSGAAHGRADFATCFAQRHNGIVRVQQLGCPAVMSNPLQLGLAACLMTRTWKEAVGAP